MKLFFAHIKMILLACSILFSLESMSQKQQLFKLTKTIPGNYSDFTVDMLGNIYLLNAQNSLKKISEKGDSLAVYNNVRLFGKLTDVNATNPLKILLFYQPFSTIVVLDRFLNRRNTIDLRKQNIFTVNAISPSYDNNVWVYDEQENKLKKVDDEGKTLLETVDLRTILDSVPTPTRIIDRDGFVYLYDANKGLYTFDYYGAYKSRLRFLNWKDIEVIDKNVYGFDENNYFVYKTNSLDLRQFPLPLSFKEFNSLKLGNDKVYILKNGQVDIYSLQ